jgi:hypothetical protein
MFCIEECWENSLKIDKEMEEVKRFEYDLFYKYPPLNTVPGQFSLHLCL